MVIDYLDRAGLLKPLDALGFYLAGFGCTTCIGNSGPLLEGVSEAIVAGGLSVAAVLSGNRNFESRDPPGHPAELPRVAPLVVAYALAGTVDIDLSNEPIGVDADGTEVFLRDLWPSDAEVADAVRSVAHAGQFTDRYARCSTAASVERRPGPTGRDVRVGRQLDLRDPAALLRRSDRGAAAVHDVVGARVLAVLGNSVTTDHVSPAGSIRPNVPAGKYLLERGVAVQDFNTYGTRRGNHEVMMRGTFANLRLRNMLAPGTEGGVTTKFPEGDTDHHLRGLRAVRADGVPLMVIAGKEYGTGSVARLGGQGPHAARRACGPRRELRAHPPLQPHRDGHRRAAVPARRVARDVAARRLGDLRRRGPRRTQQRCAAEDRRGAAHRDDGAIVEFEVRLRIETPTEADYFRNGGVLNYVLRSLAADTST